MIDWFVFMDESGDLGRFGTSHFVICAIQVRDDKRLGRIIKRTRERKLKKKLAQLPELKASSSNPEIRKFVLRRVSTLECRIYVLAVEKSRICPKLMDAQNRLYNWLCRILCQQIGAGTIKMIIDKKYNNRFLREDFNRYLARELSRHGINASIEHLESHSCPPLQVADFVAWAANRKFSWKDDEYYRIIENRIANLGTESIWA